MSYTVAMANEDPFVIVINIDATNKNNLTRFDVGNDLNK